MSRELKLGRTYRHFKGGVYEVVLLDTNKETQEQMVIYRQLDTLNYYVRPYLVFMSRVDRKKYPDAKQEYRMELI